jgi:aminopeptidase-like protein
MSSTVESEISGYLHRLFPMARSITGAANRETLRMLSEISPIVSHEVPSGREVFDWTVPQEWSVREAWIADSEGHKIVSFDENALHLVGYSTSIDQTMSWEELQPHLHVHPDLPDVIPYRTSYYSSEWGFCLTHDQYAELQNLSGGLRVLIDTEHFSGSLTYGEVLIPGKSKREILISCYICHPYMANDGVSGMLLTAFLAKYISSLPSRNWSYRIIFVPETIGAITYLHENRANVGHVEAGLEITTIGGPGGFGFKKTWNSDHWLNDVIADAFHHRGIPYKEYPFDIHGADERQFSSQGFRINTGTICQDRYHEYPEYHTSADNLDLVTGAQIEAGLDMYIDVISAIEKLDFFRNTRPHGEVMLSRHNLYPTLGGAIKPIAGEKSELSLILWLLFYLDGHTPLSKIAKTLSTSEERLRPLVDQLLSLDLIDRT